MINDEFREMEYRRSQVALDAISGLKILEALNEDRNEKFMRYLQELFARLRKEGETDCFLSTTIAFSIINSAFEKCLSLIEQNNIHNTNECCIGIKALLQHNVYDAKIILNDNFHLLSVRIMNFWPEHMLEIDHHTKSNILMKTRTVTITPTDLKEFLTKTILWLSVVGNILHKDTCLPDNANLQNFNWIFESEEKQKIVERQVLKYDWQPVVVSLLQNFVENKLFASQNTAVLKEMEFMPMRTVITPENQLILSLPACESIEKLSKITNIASPIVLITSERFPATTKDRLFSFFQEIRNRMISREMDLNSIDKIIQYF